MALLDVAGFLQRHVLPDAFPRPRRHAAADSGLRDAVRGLQYARVGRRIWIWPVAASVRYRHREVRERWREGAGQAMGRRRYARVDAKLAAAVPQLRDTAGRQVMNVA